eukprot:12942730-Alexandrium_andersonii.AAC.1
MERVGAPAGNGAQGFRRRPGQDPIVEEAREARKTQAHARSLTGERAVAGLAVAFWDANDTG